MRQTAILIPILLLLAGQAGAACVGDCGGDGRVTVSDLVRAVAVALGSAAVGGCTAADTDGNGRVSVPELIGAVRNALNGCDGVTTPTPPPTPTPIDGGPTPGPCENGNFAVTFSAVSGTNADTSALDLDQVAATQVFDARSGAYSWLFNGLQCDITRTFRRGLSLSMIAVPNAFGPGTYPLIFPFAQLIFTEIEDGTFQRSWGATSGTLTIDSLADGHMAFHITAALTAAPIISTGSTPTGTFSIDVTGTVERILGP